MGLWGAGVLHMLLGCSHKDHAVAPSALGQSPPHCRDPGSNSGLRAFVHAPSLGRRESGLQLPWEPRGARLDSGSGAGVPGAGLSLERCRKSQKDTCRREPAEQAAMSPAAEGGREKTCPSSQTPVTAVWMETQNIPRSPEGSLRREDILNLSLFSFYLSGLHS